MRIHQRVGGHRPPLFAPNVRRPMAGVEEHSGRRPVQQSLHAVFIQGWPENRADVPESVQPYFDVRDSLTILDELLFKGQLLVMRKQIMEDIQATNIGIEAYIRRVRDILYWPRMATELKQYVAKCDICLVHRSGQGKEPIVQHEMVARPWAKVGADLCKFANRTLLVISDYYRNYTEVARLNRTTSRSVIK